MGVEHALYGEIRIEPPLAADEVAGFAVSFPEGKFRDLMLVMGKSYLETGLDTFELSGAISIVPNQDTYNGRYALYELQAIFQACPNHEYTGFIECHLEAGTQDLGEPTVERYICRDGEVVIIQPKLTWPEDAR
jgi:hypothetical protein